MLTILIQLLKKVTLCLCLLGAVFPIHAQTHFSNIQFFLVEQSLSGGYVVSIQEGTNGLIWISTWLWMYENFPLILAVLLVIALIYTLAKKRSKHLSRKQDEKIADAIRVIKNSMDMTPTESKDKPTASSNMAEKNSSGEKEKNKEEEASNTVDEEWLKVLDENANLLIENNKFSIVELAATMNLGERQFRRVLKRKTNLRPADYLREIRLLKAKKFLKEGKFATVAEVCYAVGFSTPKHFSRLFKDRFGKNPSEYLENSPPNSAK